MSIALVMFIGLLCYFKGLRWFCALAFVLVLVLVLLGTSPDLEAGSGASQLDVMMLQSDVAYLESRVSMLETQVMMQTTHFH